MLVNLSEKFYIKRNSVRITISGTTNDELSNI